MSDVAARADVSLKTVSRVVNGATSVNPTVAERVLRAIGELGFRRNEHARSLAAHHPADTIGLLIEDIANPHYSKISAGAAAVAQARGAMLVTVSSEEDPERERQLLSKMSERRMTGILVVPASADQSYLAREIELGTPAVFLDRPPEGVDADAVLIDDTGGARSAIEHLLRRGHTRIGILADSLAIYTMRTRLDAALARLRGAGAEDALELVVWGLHTEADMRRAVAELLRHPDPPTGLFCLNNRSTTVAISELWRRGTSLDVVGFDDFELAELMPMPLTVVSYDAAEMGRVATELLYERIDGVEAGPARRRVIPTRLVTPGANAVVRKD